MILQLDGGLSESCSCLNRQDRFWVEEAQWRTNHTRYPSGLPISGSRRERIFISVSSDEERLDALLKFLRSGLEAGERAACFTEKLDDAYFTITSQHGLSCDKLKESGAVSIAGTREAYFQDGRFDPDRMLGTLKQYHEASVTEGYPGRRVIGEMTADIGSISGGSRLMEYESRVSLLLKEHPVTAVCQYDANVFDGARHS